MNRTPDFRSVVFFLAGGATAAALALLLAPQSGAATRKRIGRSLRDTTDSALDLTQRAMQGCEDIGDEAVRRARQAGSALAG